MIKRIFGMFFAEKHVRPRFTVQDDPRIEGLSAGTLYRLLRPEGRMKHVHP